MIVFGSVSEYFCSIKKRINFLLIYTIGIPEMRPLIWI